ncbi:oxygen-insensitive NAD(P)H nitroreductase [Vibrio sp. HN007]|uniref:oxygen-insensitive NAD(P)H nitroreductase n=1 Tax=Vibrio iocasae TaxID=3098914 RepID=UPI0035D40717
MNIADVALSRYSTKEFDSQKKIPAETFDQIKKLLRFSPSSVNSQPWHFVIAESDEAKQRLTAGTHDRFVFNQAKVTDASHVVLFCAKTQIDEEYVQHILESEEKAGRFPQPEFKETVNNGRSYFVNMHRFDLKDAQHWMEKQLYLNMGTVLLGAGALNVDAVPIEGVDLKALNEEFGLLEKGYTAVALVAMGYRKETDFNASLPKARLEEEEIFTILP